MTCCEVLQQLVLYGHCSELKAMEAVQLLLFLQELFPLGFLTLCLSCWTALKGCSASAQPGLAYSPDSSLGVRLAHPLTSLT